jgi:hypothetical protein
MGAVIMRMIYCVGIICIILILPFIAIANNSVTPLPELPKIQDILPALVWNPYHSPSGDSILSSLVSAGYQAVQTDSLFFFFDSLSNYHLFVIGGINQYGEPIIDEPFFHRYQAAIDTFLEHGGSIFWEGGESLLNCCAYRDTLYDTLICYYFQNDLFFNDHSYSYLRGVAGTYFENIDSLGINRSVTDNIIGFWQGGIPMPIIAPEVGGYQKATVSIYRSARTMCTNFLWSKLIDSGANTRRDLIIDVMHWLSGSSPEPCQYTLGDINGNGSVNGVDIVYAVNFLKGTGNPPPVDCDLVCFNNSNHFYAAADVNGNCAFNGIDITYFVRFLKLQVSHLLYCPDCPPANP